MINDEIKFILIEIHFIQNRFSSLIFMTICISKYLHMCLLYLYIYVCIYVHQLIEVIIQPRIKLQLPVNNDTYTITVGNKIIDHCKWKYIYSLYLSYQQ